MVMSASSFSGFPADARILGLDIGSISVDVVLLDGLGTPLYSRYVRHHGQPDKVLCAELEALEAEWQARLDEAEAAVEQARAEAEERVAQVQAEADERVAQAQADADSRVAEAQANAAA